MEYFCAPPPPPPIIEKIRKEFLVLFSYEENTKKSTRIFKFLEEFRED